MMIMTGYIRQSESQSRLGMVSWSKTTRSFTHLIKTVIFYLNVWNVANCIVGILAEISLRAMFHYVIIFEGRIYSKYIYTEKSDTNKILNRKWFLWLSRSQSRDHIYKRNGLKNDSALLVCVSWGDIFKMSSPESRLNSVLSLPSWALPCWVANTCWPAVCR